MLRIESFPVGPLGTTCILVWEPRSQEAVVVDPGAEAARIRTRIEAQGLRVQALLHTHGHFDHVGATAELQGAYSCPAFIHPEDASLLECLEMQTSMFGLPKVPAPRMEALPEVLPLGLHWIHTPGHSRGSCTFLGPAAEPEGAPPPGEPSCTVAGPFALVGDTLFQGGVGRTDVLGGDLQALETSLRDVLYALPDETLVIPGHGPRTTIGEEARHNPFVRRRTV